MGQKVKVVKVYLQRNTSQQCSKLNHDVENLRSAEQ